LNASIKKRLEVLGVPACRIGRSGELGERVIYGRPKFITPLTYLWIRGGGRGSYPDTHKVTPPTKLEGFIKKGDIPVAPRVTKGYLGGSKIHGNEEMKFWGTRQVGTIMK